MPRTVAVFILIVAAFAVGVGLGAQPEFQAGVELVTVPVTVRHRDRSVVLSPLSAADFRMSEDGREQRIVLFEPDRRPVSLAILLDVSTSMAGLRQTLAAKAAHLLHAALNRDDEISFVPFADWALVAIPWTRVGLLPTLDAAQWVLPWDTALLDAVVAALELADTSTHSRRVVVVISDGFENASAISLQALATTRRQSELEVYALRVNPVEGPPGQVTHPVLSPRREFEPRDVLPSLVAPSGGLVYNVPTDDYLMAAVLSLMSDLRNQYLIGYESTRPLDGTYRRLRVDARTQGLVIRHRAGFLALPARR